MQLSWLICNPEDRVASMVVAIFSISCEVIMSSFDLLIFAFFASLPLLFIIIVTIILIVVRWKLWAARNWESTDGLVLESIVDEYDEGYYPKITYQYGVDEQIYRSSHICVGEKSYSFGKRRTEQLVAQFPVGSQVTVYYNPKKPVKSVLMRGDRGLSRSLLTMICVLLIMFLAIIVPPAIIYGMGWLAKPNR